MTTFISHTLPKLNMKSHNNTIGILLAGVKLDCQVHYAQSRRYLRRYIVEPEGSSSPVHLDEEDIDLIRTGFPPDQAPYDAEIKMLASELSDALLPFDRFIIHSVALIVDEQAWLLAAPSGTGKTTQYRNLKQLYPDAVRIVCGDNPVLQFMEDGTILVHHSPWNGKEGYGSGLTAPLSGLVLLEQAPTNQLSRIAPYDAVVPVFKQIHTFLKTEEHVHRLFRLEEKLLKAVPIWQFLNRGDLNSSEMLYRVISGTEE